MQPAASTIALNLVAFAETPVRAERLRDRMIEVAARHRAQTLLLDASEHPCGTEDLQREIRHRTVAGVPTALFWAGNSLTDGRFETAARLCTVALVNTSQMEDGRQALRDLAQVSNRLDRRVHDLSYLHLVTWQELIARFFDDAALVPELPRLNRLIVTAGSPAHAFYLAGWLASRLGWEPCGERELCNAEGATIRVEIAIEGPYHRIGGVELHSERAAFTISADAGGHVAALHTSSKVRIADECAPIAPFDFVAVVDRALHDQHTDIHFDATLERAVALLGYER